MTGTVNIKKITSAASDIGAKLGTIWTPIQRVLTFSPADDMIASQKNLSVSIDKGNISVAYGARFLSKINITGLKEYSFEEERYPQPEDLLSSLSLAVNEFNTSNTDITLSIPKAWTIIRTVDFPSTVEENLPDAVSYELDRLTPFTADEAFFDFRVFSEAGRTGDKGDRISLLLTAAKADQIRPYMDILKENGFAVSRITVNLSAIGALCRYTDRKSDALFVEIGNKGYEGGLFINGLPVHNFSGALTGLDDVTKAEMISGDINSLLKTAKNKGMAPQVIALLKDKSPVFIELLKARLDMPFRVMSENGHSGDANFRLKLPAPHKEMPYAAVGGLIQSLWTEANGLNLLKKGRHEKQKTPLALTILLLLAIAGVWIFYLIAPLKVEEKRLQEISGQIGSKKEEAKKVETLKMEADALRAEIAVINNFKNDRIMALNILKELTLTLPKTAWLSRTRLTTTAVDIEGYASAATELLPKLEASKYFRKVEFASSTIRDARMKADRFNIKMEIEETKNSKGEKISNEKK